MNYADQPTVLAELSEPEARDVCAWFAQKFGWSNSTDTAPTPVEGGTLNGTVTILDYGTGIDTRAGDLLVGDKFYEFGNDDIQTTISELFGWGDTTLIVGIDGARVSLDNDELVVLLTRSVTP